jgi:hypothetical protein
VRTNSVNQFDRSRSIWVSLEETRLVMLLHTCDWMVDCHADISLRQYFGCPFPSCECMLSIEVVVPGTEPLSEGGTRVGVRVGATRVPDSRRGTDVITSYRHYGCHPTVDTVALASGFCHRESHFCSSSSDSRDPHHGKRNIQTHNHRRARSHCENKVATKCLRLLRLRIRRSKMPETQSQRFRPVCMI